MAITVEQPYKNFAGLDGKPLTGGLVYVGAVNLDPTTNPIPVFWDEAMTIPAAQPLLTNAGYIVRNGTPSRVYTATDYSLSVRTLSNTLVYYSSKQGIVDYSASSGSALLGFIQSGSGAVSRTVQSKLRESISVKDFGAKGDGMTDDAPAINTAIASIGYGKSLYFPAGTYNIASKIVVNATSGMTTGLLLHGDGDGTVLQPTAIMTSMIEVNGKTFTIEGMSLINASSFAANGLEFTNDGNDASVTASIRDNTISGFVNGISAKSHGFTITENFFQNNTTHVNFLTDGRNTSIHNNYMLGGAIGVRLDQSGYYQAEGIRILNNTILVTEGNGAGVYITAGLEVYIGENIIDQTGTGSPAVYAMATGVQTISRLKIYCNWLSGGLDSYCVFASGNITNLDIIQNTIPSTNSQTVIAGISLAGVARGQIAFNNFLLNGGIDIAYDPVANSELYFVNNVGSGNNNPLPNRFGESTFIGQINLENGQIAFPNVQNPHAAANVLDDYREGTWTPTVAASNGTLGATTATGSYTKIGRMVSFHVVISITTNGTGSGNIAFNLPFPATVGGVGSGKENGVSGNMLQCLVSTNVASVVTYSNGYPGANGASLLVSATYFT